jgi:hypothetical protein
MTGIPDQVVQTESPAAQLDGHHDSQDHTRRWTKANGHGIAGLATELQLVPRYSGHRLRAPRKCRQFSVGIRQVAVNSAPEVPRVIGLAVAIEYVATRLALTSL